MKKIAHTIFLFLVIFTCGKTFPEEFWKEIEDERIVHECGVALVRLKKPLGFYIERYHDPGWGVKKLMALMEKQRNRGQDGAGIAVVKCPLVSGKEYLHQFRSVAPNSIDYLFEQVVRELKETSPDNTQNEMSLKESSPFIGEAFLGHLRYATHSGFDLKYCQPFVRSHGMPCRHFALAGNFNMTNSPELMNELEQYGVFPSSASDTQIILDTLAYHLDAEYEQIAQEMKNKNLYCNANEKILESFFSNQIDMAKVLQNAAMHWDGGYLFCGIMGNGDAFVCRDPAGIRPGYYVSNEEVFAVASEKIALMDVFDLAPDEVLPVQPGSILIFKQGVDLVEKSLCPPLPKRECSFERIYFSKGNDPEIYKERKALGKNLAERVFEAIDGDLTHTIFSYVPNSSIVAFQGLVEEIAAIGLRKNFVKLQDDLGKKNPNLEEIQKYLDCRPRIEYLITKNQRIRTFISSDQIRKTLVAQLYEVTKGIVTPNDTLVVVDDSIVRGTTLKESLIKNLIRLNPKKIIVVSSAPPVIYPDCYGIDMSQLGRFVAFQAAVSLLKEHNKLEILDKIKSVCLNQQNIPPSQIKNYVKEIYEQFSVEEIEKKVAELVFPSDTSWNGSLDVIYQTIQGLHNAIPDFQGDWYFTGDYPTPGGYKTLNTSYLNWVEGLDARSY